MEGKGGEEKKRKGGGKKKRGAKYGSECLISFALRSRGWAFEFPKVLQ